MALSVLNICPNTLVPVTIPPEPVTGVSMNGWAFTSKPAVPYQRKFRVTLHGLRWYLDGAGLYNAGTDPTRNARALELFYQAHGNWKSFLWLHPHIGQLEVRFSAPVSVPEGIPNSGGLIKAFEINLIEHNPGFG
ncbi:hypothetical protein KNJ79_05385 [Sphingopyxis indica]|uniref:hypothetical protein n=1 Tax=Sphingopyxis indica TaxID=436663 RepID=UPI002938DC33|nr:hypothetical protein [Sphingopyxis indica]WOF44366.1 hypothetical protein KNJ79_05385 [Sphingopyxis indica]